MDGVRHSLGPGENDVPRALVQFDMNTLKEYEIDLVTFLEYDSPQAGESMRNEPKKDGKDWKGWISLGLAVLALVGGSIWKISSEFANLDKHIGRVETAVRIMGAKQGGDTKTLIDEALAVAKNASDSGRAESAQKVLDIANRLLAQQVSSPNPAPQEFFDSAIQTYKTIGKSPGLSDAALDGATRLVEYRSALATVPTGRRVSIGELSTRGKFQYLKDSFISGPNGLAIGDVNGIVLDGLWLDNVVFENSHIIYKGGPVILQNVRFVNCKFDVRRSPQSEQFLEAAIKQPVSATIG